MTTTKPKAETLWDLLPRLKRTVYIAVSHYVCVVNPPMSLFHTLEEALRRHPHALEIDPKRKRYRVHSTNALGKMDSNGQPTKTIWLPLGRKT